MRGRPRHSWELPLLLLIAGLESLWGGLASGCDGRKSKTQDPNTYTPPLKTGNVSKKCGDAVQEANQDVGSWLAFAKEFTSTGNYTTYRCSHNGKWALAQEYVQDPCPNITLCPAGARDSSPRGRQSL